MIKKYLNYKFLLGIFAVIALWTFVGPHISYALTVTPVRFEVSGNPGDKITDKMLLTNETDAVETYSASYANFEAQGESGSPAFTEPVDGLGTWIETSEKSFVILPREQKVVPFTITIPEDAEPGGYFAVIFWGTVSPNSSGVSIGTKTGILVLLSVNGEVREDAGLIEYKIAENEFWHDTLPVSFEYRFRNDGGDKVKPHGKITIRNTVFFPTERIDANAIEGNVLPNSTRKFKVDWVNYERVKDYVAPEGFIKKFWDDAKYQWKNFAVGLYSAKLDLAYGNSGENVQKTVYFFVFPWQLVLLMVIVGFLIIWGGVKIIKHYNNFIIEKSRAEKEENGQNS